MKSITELVYATPHLPPNQTGGQRQAGHHRTRYHQRGCWQLSALQVAEGLDLSPHLPCWAACCIMVFPDPSSSYCSPDSWRK